MQFTVTTCTPLPALVSLAALVNPSEQCIPLHNTLGLLHNAYIECCLAHMVELQLGTIGMMHDGFSVAVSPKTSAMS